MERLERIYRYEQSCEFLPHRLKSLALSLPDKKKERVEELRLRVMHPLTVLTLEGELNAAPDGRASLVTAEDLEQMLGAVTEYSRYACIETLRQGFLPLRGGFRLGVCGSSVVRDGEVSNLKDISSLALRIVCEHIGLGSDIAPQLFSADGRFLSTLILSPPGGGKTTLCNLIPRFYDTTAGTIRIDGKDIRTVTLKSLRMRRIISGRPKIVVRDGQIEQATMQDLRLSVDDLMTALRQQQVFDISQVQFAVMETTGTISVYLKAECQPLTPADITLKKTAQNPPVAVIQDGCVMNKSLAMLGKNQAWLEQKLAEHRLTEKQVFLMLSDAEGTCTIIPKKRGDAA